MKYVQTQIENNFVNYQTGEVTSQQTTKVLKVDNNPEKFFKFFVDNMGHLYGLKTASSFKVLMAILSKATNRDNVVILSAEAKKEISEEANIHRNIVFKAINELVEKEIILPNTTKKKHYVLNPYIFGQGSFIDVQKLRQSIQYEYDFKEGIVKQTMSADAITQIGQRVLENPNNYEVIKALEQKDEANHRVDLVVREKDLFYDVEKDENLEDSNLVEQVDKNNNLKSVLVNTNDIDMSVPSADEKNNNTESNSKFLELELLKEQNRAKELILEEERLKIKSLELQLELKKLENK